MNAQNPTPLGPGGQGRPHEWTEEELERLEQARARTLPKISQLGGQLGYRREADEMQRDRASVQGFGTKVSRDIQKVLQRKRREKRGLTAAEHLRLQGLVALRLQLAELWIAEHPERRPRTDG